MELFEVYPLMDLEIVSGNGSWVTDANGKKYLDLYGGHAVISIGHSHEVYLNKLKNQLERLGFYSNSVHNSIQKKLALKLGEQSGYVDYSLFLCNSGAEAVEFSMKIASFHNGKSEFISFKKGFHGRSAAALAITDNDKIKPAGLPDSYVHFAELNNIDSVEAILKEHDISGVIIEPIQGIAGINVAEPDFLQQLEVLCKKYGVLLILDEIQAGFGRTGHFFAHQLAGIKPDLITMAKGMGNGFPIGGVLIHPDIKPSYGMLGTTFGGNHLASTAGLAVLEVLEEEDLIESAREKGDWFIDQLKSIDYDIKVTGRGLMIGLHFPFPIKALRSLLVENGILTGSSSNPNVLRILPALSVSKEELNIFLETLKTILQSTQFKDEQFSIG